MTDNGNSVVVDMTNLSDDERKQLIALMEKANTPKDNRWKPQHRDKYYYFNSFGEVNSDHWSDHRVDKGRFAIGNCYETEEAAQFAAEKRKVIAELKQFTDDQHNGGCEYYYLVCGSDKGNIRIHHGDMYTGELHFATEELAKQAIATVGADRIKKYYLHMFRFS